HDLPPLQSAGRRQRPKSRARARRLRLAGLDQVADREPSNEEYLSRRSALTGAQGAYAPIRRGAQPVRHRNRCSLDAKTRAIFRTSAVRVAGVVACVILPPMSKGRSEVVEESKRKGVYAGVATAAAVGLGVTGFPIVAGMAAVPAAILTYK